MKIRLAVSALATVALAVSAQAQTVDEIIAKNLEARGGIEKLRAIRSIVVTAQLASPEGSGPRTVFLLRPNLFREERTVGSAKTIYGFDGQSAWVLNQKDNHEEVHPITGGDLENLREEAENGIDSALVDYASKGNHVRLDGTATVEGKLCYAVRITLRNGQAQTQYLDAKSFLEIHEEMARTVNGNHVLVEQTLGDYREEGGILFAHSIVTHLAGRPERSTLTIEKIELNPAVDEEIFHMPKPGASGNGALQSSFFPPALVRRKACAARSA
ncbi:MAG TPA: hypothetical protein VJW51_00945 [Candidatus Acidoferrales bacterium]|nr:hypothetical protein [Candidatus Acidoferrales bacterium]